MNLKLEELIKKKYKIISDYLKHKPLEVFS